MYGSSWFSPDQSWSMSGKWQLFEVCIQPQWLEATCGVWHLRPLLRLCLRRTVQQDGWPLKLGLARSDDVWCFIRFVATSFSEIAKAQRLLWQMYFFILYTFSYYITNLSQIYLYTPYHVSDILVKEKSSWNCQSVSSVPDNGIVCKMTHRTLSIGLDSVILSDIKWNWKQCFQIAFSTFWERMRQVMKGVASLGMSQCSDHLQSLAIFMRNVKAV